MTELERVSKERDQARADLQTLINAVKSHRGQLSAEDLRYAAKSQDHVDNVVREIEGRWG